MKTIKLYLENSYLSVLDTTVTKVAEQGIYLAATIFSPQGGGCPGDIGIIQGITVENTIKDSDGEPLHVCQPNCFNIGDNVACALDWNRRYRIMRLHSASHLTEHFLFERFGELKRAGNFLTENGDNCTYETTAITPEDVDAIAVQCNRFISEGGDIVTSADVNEPAIRYWVCKGIIEKCGSPHIKDISEVGDVLIKKKGGGAGKIKIVTTLR